MKSAVSSNSDEVDIAIEDARTEIEKTDAALARAVKATYSAFSGVRDGDLGSIDSNSGLGLIHSGYNDIEYDNVDDAPLSASSANLLSAASANPVSASGREKPRTECVLTPLSSKKVSEREIRCATDTDADGFKRPLPPKRIHKSCEDFLSFLDSPPSGDDFLTGESSGDTSGSLSHGSTSPGEHCSRQRDGREEEEEEREVENDAQERDHRLVERDPYEVLDLSLPKRR